MKTRHGASCQYRADIDGLRALAVVPVVLFHAGVAGIEGGFVGVDVFFVISGFLITQILYREANAGELSIARFYERRVRRIMPNLLTMILLTSAACLLILIPQDLKFYAKSLLSTLAFAANIYFYAQLNYFAPTAQQFPLLHMWSLGVEEQYYLIFPFIIMRLATLGTKPLRLSIFLISIASFAISMWQVTYSPNAAFYLPFGRFWELTAGSLLAVGAIPALKTATSREACAAIGLLSVAFAMLTYDAHTAFPGASALLPTLGTAAMIHANSHGGLTRVGRLLSWSPLVTIGLISYSLYIWHWPIIVLTRYVLQRESGTAECAAMLVAIFVIAWAAWQLIEKPMRSTVFETRRLLKYCGTAAASFMLMAVVMFVSGGMPQRYSAGTRQLALATEDINPERHSCDHPSLVRLAAGDVCRVGPHGPARFAMIGDSFGDALMPAFARAADLVGVPGLVITESGCAPLPDVDERYGRCREQVMAAYALLARERSLTHVFLVGRWPTMISGSRSGLFQQDQIWLLDRISEAAGAAENRRVIARGFARATESIGQSELIVVVGIPEQQVHVPQAATLARLMGGTPRSLSRSEFDVRQAATLDVLRSAEVLSRRNVGRLSFAEAMCDKRVCPVVEGDTALYVDDNHPSRSFALRLAPVIAPFLRPARRP